MVKHTPGFLFLWSAMAIAAQPPQQQRLVTSEFGGPGSTGSPVGISVDDQGRVYVTETHRRTYGEVDIRKHQDWLVDSLSFMSVEEKRRFLRENYRRGEGGDANKDGVVDWRDLAVPSEKVNLLVDTDGDGKADRKTTFADQFNSEVSGVAGGVLAFGGNVFLTITPDLWRVSDTDGDGVADQRQSLAHGFGIHVGYGGHDMHGPTMGPDGMVYWSIGDKAFSVTSKDGRKHHYPYHGAVLRCHPDGSGFEVFAHGLRNPQELAFDDFGNLFSVDNDGDFGDRERFVFIVEGSDTGWRATWQYRNQKKAPGYSGYNPWLNEQLWKPQFDGQAAYITPALANYSDGPCGFKYNPGTALSERYRGHFFLTEFPGKKVRAFKAEADGARFRMTDEHVAASGLMLTGIAFGPDGALYGADWGENPWLPHPKGRVMRMDDPAGEGWADRAETKTLLREGVAQFLPEGLWALLGHADQRVRMRVQFELVKRPAGAEALRAAAERHPQRLGRIHGIWGVAQLARTDAKAAEALVPLLADVDVEVRGNAAKAIGDARLKSAADAVAKLLADDSPRVRFLAGMALGKIGGVDQLKAVVRTLEENNDRDAFLRHAGVMAMAAAGADDALAVVRLSESPSPAVRVAAVVALRRSAHRSVAVFLNDADERVATEAARAIHDDFSIAGAIPELAGILAKPGLTHEALLRRAINANLRVGTPECAQRLAAYAAGSAGGPAVRAEAMLTLAEWANPPVLDRVEGRHRRLDPRDAAVAKAAIEKHLAALLSSNASEVRTATAVAIRQLNYVEAADRLTKLALDESQPAGTRAAAMEVVVGLKDPSGRTVVDAGLKAGEPELRAVARTLLARIDPSEKTVAALREALAKGELVERQGAIAALGEMAADRSKPAADLLEQHLKNLVAGTADAKLTLDIVEAANETKAKRLTDLVKKYESAKPKDRPAAQFVEALEGGNARLGAEVFKTSAQCVQCHMINGVGGGVGPDLTKIGARLDRQKILESIVDPQAVISEGFATIAVTDLKGRSVTGIVIEETDALITLKEPDGNVVKVRKANVKSRTAPGSAMPTMTEVIKAREIRDLVEYLSTLK